MSQAQPTYPPNLLMRWKFALRNKSEADDLAGGVERRGFGSQDDFARVGLGQRGEIFQQTRNATHAQQKDTRGVGVECSRMSDFARAQQAARFRNNIVRGPARVLVDDDEPVGSVVTLLRAHDSVASGSGRGPSANNDSIRAPARTAGSGANESSGVRFMRASRPIADCSL